MQTQTKATLDSIEEKSQKILVEAQEMADQIEQRARLTAAHVSVEEAQKQFKEAQKHHENQVKLWAWISVVSGVVFVGFAGLLWGLRPLSRDISSGFSDSLFFPSALFNSLVPTCGNSRNLIS